MNLGPPQSSVRASSLRETGCASGSVAREPGKDPSGAENTEAMVQQGALFPLSPW